MLSFAYPREGNDDGEPLHATDPDLSEAQRQELQRWVRRSKAAQALVLRARIVLEATAGKSDMEVAGQLGTTRATVGKWRRRFLVSGCDGSLDEPRPGAPRTIGDDDVERVVVKMLETIPVGAAHWATRSMAEACGMIAATVSRIWRAFGLKPHRCETFKLSRDHRRDTTLCKDACMARSGFSPANRATCNNIVLALILHQRRWDNAAQALRYFTLRRSEAFKVLPAPA